MARRVEMLIVWRNLLYNTCDFVSLTFTCMEVLNLCLVKAYPPKEDISSLCEETERRKGYYFSWSFTPVVKHLQWNLCCISSLKASCFTFQACTHASFHSSAYPQWTLIFFEAFPVAVSCFVDVVCVSWSLTYCSVCGWTKTCSVWAGIIQKSSTLVYVSAPLPISVNITSSIVHLFPYEQWDVKPESKFSHRTMIPCLLFLFEVLQTVLKPLNRVLYC